MLPALFALLIVAETPSQPVLTHEGHSEEATSKSEKKICRSEPMTGSRTRVTRICMTEAQWHEMSQRSAQNFDRYSSLQTSRREGAGQAQ